MRANDKMIVTGDVVYPPEMSESGSNAYYVFACSCVSYSTPYAACLNRIKKHSEGTLSDIYEQCGVAIEQKSCEAKRMQNQEKISGRAMFYIDRADIRKQADEMAEIAESRMSKKYPDLSVKSEQAEIKHVPKQKPAEPIKKAVEVSVENGYAAAINAAIAEELLKAEKKTESESNETNSALVQSSRTQVKSGMSLLELASTLKAAN